MIKKPAWLLFGEACRARISARERRSKSGKREEAEIYRWWLEACAQYGYKGTEDDWQFLVGWRGRR